MCGSIGHCNSIDCITNMFHLMIGHSEYLVATYFLSDRTFTTFPLLTNMTNTFIKLSIKPSIYVFDRTKLDGGPSEVINVLCRMFYQVIPGFYVFWLCSVAKTEKMLFCLQEKCCSLTEGSFAVIASNSAINPLTWQKISPIISFIFFII